MLTLMKYVPPGGSIAGGGGGPSHAGGAGPGGGGGGGRTATHRCSQLMSSKLPLGSSTHVEKHRFSEHEALKQLYLAPGFGAGGGGDTLCGSGTAAHIADVSDRLCNVASLVHMPVAFRPCSIAQLYLIFIESAESNQSWWRSPLAFLQLK